MPFQTVAENIFIWQGTRLFYGAGFFLLHVCFSAYIYFFQHQCVGE